MKHFNMNSRYLIFVIAVTCFTLIFAQNDDQKEVEWSENDPRWISKIPNWWDEENFVPPVGPAEEKKKSFWNDQGQNLLHKKVNKKLNTNKAKNLVIFIGDGMGLATLMATRSYIEDVKTELSFEKFDHSGLSKAYCINYQTSDSACTATAILTGVKNNYGTVAVTGDVNLRNCSGQQDEANRVDSIFKYAQDAQKSTGVITTTRITHATPSACYAHTASRYWESNENTAEGCDDIALQLIHGEVGSKLDVAMGGGRRHFLPTRINGGLRTDDRDLIDEYLNLQEKNGFRARVVQNRSELFAIDASTADKIFGLFASSHMEYRILADEAAQPTLKEMVEKSLEVLSKNENGFVLMVEGGRIDTAHHDTLAQLALDETKEFQKAIEFVKSKTNEEDTLIVVTADHSTSMTVSGYAPRGFNILGPGDYSRSDEMWFYSLSYANGPGYSYHVNPTGGRQNPKGKSYLDPAFRQPATVPESEQTHAAEDVGVYANGPFSHIFSGVYEQSYIAHAMMFATCLGPKDFLKNDQCSSAEDVKVMSTLLLVVMLFVSRI